MEQQTQTSSGVTGKGRRGPQRTVFARLACCTIVALGPMRSFFNDTATTEIYTYAGADRGERLIAKAREEGTLTLYTSIATTESTPLARAFESKYGVKVQVWRALSENVVQRALTESRGGRRGMDAVETNAPAVTALPRQATVAQFQSPYLADLPPWAIPPHRRWFADRANLWVVGYVK